MIKSKSGYLLKLLSSFLFFFIATSLYGQEKVNITAGIGFPELLNAGIRYSFPQTQIGINVGTLPIPDESNLAISGDLLFHVGGFSKLNTRRPWYIKTGLTYHELEDKFRRYTYIFIYPRMGRELNLTRKIGFQLEVGASVQLFREVENITPPNINLDIDFPFLPSFGGAFFYRL